MIKMNTKQLLQSGRCTTFVTTHSVSPRQKRLTPPKVYVEPSVSFAVTQQAVAYALILVGEGAYTRSQLPESNPGRPEITSVGIGAAGTVLALLLVLTGIDAVESAGFVIGLLASGFMLYYNGKRIFDTTSDGLDWPGPKAWPAGMTLISFFAFNLFLQAIRSEL